MTDDTARPPLDVEVRAAISNAYYEARNAGETMETAADRASADVMLLLARLAQAAAPETERLREAAQRLVREAEPDDDSAATPEPRPAPCEDCGHPPDAHLDSAGCYCGCLVPAEDEGRCPDCGQPMEPGEWDAGRECENPECPGLQAGSPAQDADPVFDLAARTARPLDLSAASGEWRVPATVTGTERLREALRAMVEKWAPHSGNCCTFDEDGKVIVTTESCVCQPMHKEARAALEAGDVT